MASLTGPIAFYGSAVAKGFEFLATTVRENGASTGRPVKFTVSDDQSNPLVAIRGDRRRVRLFALFPYGDHVWASKPTDSEGASLLASVFLQVTLLVSGSISHHRRINSHVSPRFTPRSMP